MRFYEKVIKVKADLAACLGGPPVFFSPTLRQAPGGRDELTIAHRSQVFSRLFKRLTSEAVAQQAFDNFIVR